VPPETEIIIERTAADTFQWSVDGGKKGSIALLPGDTLRITLPVIELEDKVEELRPSCPPFAYIIREKSNPGYIYATWSSRDDAEEMMRRAGLSKDAWEIHASEIRSYGAFGKYIKPWSKT
jgi:hypothetical protein